MAEEAVKYEMPIGLDAIKEKNLERIREFQRKARAKGAGYQCPNFPMFNQYMEGLESGLYMFAGESNHGKSAFVLSLAWDYMMCEDNHLYCIYFSLDDSADDIFPRVIAMNQNIPISVASKPGMYEEKMRTEDEARAAIYSDWLMRSEEGINQLINLGAKFTLFDGADITCGEDILRECQDIKTRIVTEDEKANIIVVIDSLMDIDWRDQKFSGGNQDKQKNDYTARQVKHWAVDVLDCPILATLHLRKIDQNRRPAISDVKESGRYAYEASFLGLIYNDVSRNKQSATISARDAETDQLLPVIELDWAKNKKSSFKGMTYQTFITNHSLVRECPPEEMDRFNHLLYSA